MFPWSEEDSWNFTYLSSRVLRWCAVLKPEKWRKVPNKHPNISPYPALLNLYPPFSTSTFQEMPIESKECRIFTLYTLLGEASLALKILKWSRSRYEFFKVLMFRYVSPLVGVVPHHHRSSRSASVMMKAASCGWSGDGARRCAMPL